MLITRKEIGETPLELLDRLREEKIDLKDETLSYAGRLDPMAEGEMLILVGEEENKDYKKYLGFDKEYIATFMIGLSTDTGDILGLIKEDFDIQINKIETDFLKDIKEQTYPWFSSMTVDGKKLFDHYKEGNLDIERPKREVKIYESELINEEERDLESIREYIFSSIDKVNGDFRQKEILNNWKEYFDKEKSETKKVFQARLRVSSGTYIRALTENFDFPVVLLNLNRTKIFV